MHVSLSRSRTRRLTRWAAAATALAVPFALLGTAPAQAQPRVSEPTTPGGEALLRSGAVVALAPGARDVQVAESPFGGAVAVSWTVRNGQGIDEVWARVKDERAWGAGVRVSDPSAAASRPSMDLDSDGSLLVGWAEQRGSTRALVARRVTGSTAGPRRVFPVDTDDGPYVAAGALHDVVAWTAPSGGVVRPFAAVDTGGGFAAPVAISSPSWKYDVLPATLAVNADSQQVHALYLSEDSDVGWAQTSWSVLDSTRGTTWLPTDDLGPRQVLETPVRRPQVATDSRGRAVLVVHDTDEGDPHTTDDDVVYPKGQIFDPATPGPLRDRVGEFRSLEVIEDGVPRDLLGLHHRRGVVMAAYAGPAFLKHLTHPSPDSRGFEFATFTAYSGCTPFDEWFVVGLQDPSVLCLDTETDTSGADILVDGLGRPMGVLSTLRPDPALPGSRVLARVPDPLVPLILLTEDLAGDGVAGAGDPVWLLDHTEGGSDTPAPLLEFTRLTAPSITGKPVVGQKFRAVIGSWRPGPSEVAHRWFVNGTIVKGATGATFTLKKAHRGKRISVRLFLSRAGYADVVAEAKRTQKIKPKPKKKRKKR